VSIEPEIKFEGFGGGALVGGGPGPLNPALLLVVVVNIIRIKVNVACSL